MKQKKKQKDSSKQKGALKKITLLTFPFLAFIIVFALYREISYTPPDPHTIPTEFIEEVHSQNCLLRHYYIDFSQRKYLDEKAYDEAKFDEEGVPLFRDFYHPVYICQYSLGAFEHHLNSGDKEAMETFLACATWLRDNLKRHNGFFYWEYHRKLRYPGGPDKVPWFSAMAQGQGASVLLRAFCETGQEDYLRAAEKAIEPIFHTVTEGGVSIIEGNDYVFPQEYPTNPPSDVLNGSIFSYIGVYEYYRVTGDSRAKQFCDKITKTYLAVIGQYDTGYWSLYSRWPEDNVASPLYNSLHVAQLKALYLITGEEKFLRYSERFANYQSSWIKRTMFTFANYRKRIRNFELKDIKKMPLFIRTILFKGTYP